MRCKSVSNRIRVMLFTRDERSAKRGVAIVNRPSVRQLRLSVRPCVTLMYRGLDWLQIDYTNN